MTAADELRTLTAAATPGPWDQAEHAPWMIDSPGPAVAACVHKPDAELIVWLVNHAQALADLLTAADALVQPAGWWKGVEQRQEHQLLDRRAVVRDALAALEAR